ncbi:MAG: hypothetical protein CMB28_05685 [Euryarchaeota archaeon]|nr:hypothetical protein [Euryarchaeota archaeon]
MAPLELTAAPAEETIIPATTPKTPKQQQAAPNPESDPIIPSRIKTKKPIPIAAAPDPDNQFFACSTSAMVFPSVIKS